MIFFFDRNVSEHLAKMLDAVDRDNTMRHQDWDARFDPTSLDLVLIEAVSTDEPKPIWVTADLNQVRRNADERIALGNSGMTAIFFRSGFHDHSPWDQARLLVTVWPSVILQCSNVKEPTIFEVGAQLNTRKVEKVCLTRELIISKPKRKR